MKPYLNLIDTSTTGRYDVTPLFADGDALANLATDINDHFRGKFDIVAGIDSLGFVLGTAIAMQLGKGILTLRKGGKLPSSILNTSFVDYSGTEKTLEVRSDVLLKDKRVLIVDEWIETGSQMKAAVSLIEKLNGSVTGITAINIEKNEKTKALTEEFDCFWVWDK